MAVSVPNSKGKPPSSRERGALKGVMSHVSSITTPRRPAVVGDVPGLEPVSDDNGKPAEGSRSRDDEGGREGIRGRRAWWDCSSSVGEGSSDESDDIEENVDPDAEVAVERSDPLRRTPATANGDG